MKLLYSFEIMSLMSLINQMINQMLQNVTSKYKGLSFPSPHSIATLFLYSSAITKGPLFFI